MSNGALCCAAGVCCPPDVARKKLTDMLMTIVPSCAPADVEAMAGFVHAAFVLVPRGNGLETLVSFLQTHRPDQGDGPA